MTRRRAGERPQAHNERGFLSGGYVEIALPRKLPFVECLERYGMHTLQGEPQQPSQLEWLLRNGLIFVLVDEPPRLISIAIDRQLNLVAALKTRGAPRVSICGFAFVDGDARKQTEHRGIRSRVSPCVPCRTV